MAETEEEREQARKEYLDQRADTDTARGMYLKEKDGKTDSEEIGIGSINAQLDDIRTRLESVKRKRRGRLR